MNVNLTIKNYRCFPDSEPARLPVRKGFTGFIGTNNSGKSSLLKFFYEFRHIFQILSGPDGGFIHALNGRRHGFSYPVSVTDPNEVFSKKNARDLLIELEFPVDAPVNTRGIPFISKLEILVYRGTNNWSAKILGPGQEVNNKANDFQGSEIRDTDGVHRVDVSPLFTACESLKRTLYIGAYRNILNVGGSESYFDIQVGQAFITQWRTYLTGQIRSQNEATYQVMESIKHIFDFQDFQVNQSADNTTLQLFVNGKSYRLQELGSGIAQFVLVLANAAVSQPNLILIDEPELNLHPSLQLDFLTSLASYAKDGMMFGTHNIGLARSSATQIFSLVRIEDGVSRLISYEKTPRLSEFLGELSYSGYKSLGFDKVLLVEGPTDVPTVQQFLRKCSSAAFRRRFSHK